MSDQVDVEIYVIPRDVKAASYEVQLRVVRPGDLTLNSPVRGEIRLDPEPFVELEERPADYGLALFNAILPAGPVRQAFDDARKAAAVEDAGLRVRLVLDATAPRLHDFLWETLRSDPKRWLLSDGRLFFSRFLSADEGRIIKPARLGALTALVGVASAIDLTYPELKPVDVDAQIARATNALGGIPIATLGGRLPEKRLTLDRLITALDRAPDILFLMCHGIIRNHNPIVLLEHEDGTAHAVRGQEIAARIGELPSPPRLVVLASCQSAGEGRTLSTNDNGALAGLGPLLARAGVPAVVAMQGNIEIATMDRFMPVFFEELVRSRCPDRAMAVARSLVRDADDAHEPVLFSRLRDGLLWYRPGFGAQKGIDAWGDLVNALAKGECLPIVGPGLLDPLLGDSGDMARRWADGIGYTRQGPQRLSEVAQFIATEQTSLYLLEWMYRDWRQQALRLGRRVIDGPEAARFGAKPDPIEPSFLLEILERIGALQRAMSDDNAYRVLAQMQVPIYIATTPDNLLADALLEAGRPPTVEVLRWNQREEAWPSRFDERGFMATTANPVVYHLFGHLRRPTSLVLTEDDFFDYLMYVGTGNMPTSIKAVLANSALLFLGFQVDDWRFRVLYRSIVTEERTLRTPGLPRRSVSVQLEPDQQITEPQRLRRLFEDHFRTARVQTYWGTAQDFATELSAQWKAKVHAG